LFFVCTSFFDDFDMLLCINLNKRWLCVSIDVFFFFAGSVSTDVEVRGSNLLLKKNTSHFLVLCFRFTSNVSPRLELGVTEVDTLHGSDLRGSFYKFLTDGY
jgi:hypothetical protein